MYAVVQICPDNSRLLLGAASYAYACIRARARSRKGPHHTAVISLDWQNGDILAEYRLGVQITANMEFIAPGAELKRR